jgi:hypothetical protein
VIWIDLEQRRVIGTRGALGTRRVLGHLLRAWLAERTRVGSSYGSAVRATLASGIPPVVRCANLPPCRWYPMPAGGSADRRLRLESADL